MFDAEGEKSTQGMGGALGDNATRKANVQRAIAAVSSLEKLVSQFHSLEESVGSAYVSFDKKLDGFYQDVFAAVGKFSAIIDNATSYLVDRDAEYSDAALAQSKDTSPEFKKGCAEIKDAMTQCRAALADGSKMIAVLKNSQASLDKEEDEIRTSVVAFKKNRTDFATNYGKVSSLKNEIFAQANDGKIQTDQIDEMVKKTQALYDQLNSKDSQSIMAVMKKVESEIVKSKSDIDALKTLMDKVKGFITSVGKNEDAIARKNERAIASSILKVKKNPFNKSDEVTASGFTDPAVSDEDDVLLGSEGMPYAVLRTIGQGFKTLWANLVKVFVTIRGKRVLANTGDLIEDPLLSEKKSELKSAAWDFGSGAWKLCVSTFDYVKHVFVQLSARPSLSDAVLLAPPSSDATLDKKVSDVPTSGADKNVKDSAVVSTAPSVGLTSPGGVSSVTLPSMPQLAPAAVPTVAKVPLPLPVAVPVTASTSDATKSSGALPPLPAMPGLPQLPALPSLPKI